MSRVSDAYIAMRIIRLLSTDFKKWEAYALNIIDKDGKIINKAKTADEKSAMTPLMNVIRNIKRLMVKIPGGKNIMSSLAVGLLLLKEDLTNNKHNSDYILNEVYQYLDESLNKTYRLRKLYERNNNNVIVEGRYVLDSPFYNRQLIYVKDIVEMNNDYTNTRIFQVNNLFNERFYVSFNDLVKI